MKKRATAFHAELSNSIQNLPHNHKVVFDKIHLNEGGAYDPKTGIFTCKEPGIYVFDWTILTNDGQYFSTDLMVDGEVRGRLHLAASNIKNDRSGSNMVVAKLKPGSKVWVEPYSTYTGQYAHGRWSSFSGFKIWLLNLYIKNSINMKPVSEYFMLLCWSLQIGGEITPLHAAMYENNLKIKRLIDMKINIYVIKP